MASVLDCDTAADNPLIEYYNPDLIRDFLKKRNWLENRETLSARGSGRVKYECFH